MKFVKSNSKWKKNSFEEIWIHWRAFFISGLHNYNFQISFTCPKCRHIIIDSWVSSSQVILCLQKKRKLFMSTPIYVFWEEEILIFISLLVLYNYLFFQISAAFDWFAFILINFFFCWVVWLVLFSYPLWEWKDNS